VGGATIDAGDVARFDRLGDEWWEPKGAMAPLHKLNPTRIRYLRDLMGRHFARAGRDAARPLGGLRLLDIGCGGGLLSEPLARLGAMVTGIDPAPNNIAVAIRHAQALDVEVDYRAETAEALVAAGETFDVVLAMEVVEHVPQPDDFVRMACLLVRPGGLLVLSTLNRTAKSFALAIVGAEYVLRWLPRGTHRWQQFLTPEELAMPVRAAGLKVIERQGLVYDILRDRWTTSPDTAVNYLLAAVRPTSAP
jgi:2-polyprenyl-6-hydroxyphenyl methylase/3-demethylubiquinone-9 3-methyltransferase